MVNRQMVTRLAGALVVMAFVAGWRSGVAEAYTCEAVIKAAEERITEAEAKLKSDTDARIKA